MDSIDKIGKTVDEAVEQALFDLKASRDEVEIVILDAGSKGLFGGFLGGIGSKPARVRVDRKITPALTAKKFLREISAAMRVSVEVEADLQERTLSIVLSGPDAGKLIGKHGQTLDSLQYLVSLVVNKGAAPFVNVLMDCENYRQKRKETLEALARNLAKKAKLTKKNVVLEPMSSYERRIIHSALQGDKSVSTFSEGEEPYRNVIISPKVYRQV